ncbi:MAG: hypothetical protein AAGD04_17290 [Pseudomonadota bacterium]
MTPFELERLSQLSQARQDADAAKLRSFHAEESRIRAQLAALNTTHKSARDLPTLETLPLHRVGGDLLWQRWVGRRRRELQMQLARCLASKGTAQRHLQESFGKSSALHSLRRDVQARELQAKTKKELEAVTEIGVLRRST